MAGFPSSSCKLRIINKLLAFRAENHNLVKLRFPREFHRNPWRFQAHGLDQSSFFFFSSGQKNYWINSLINIIKRHKLLGCEIKFKRPIDGRQREEEVRNTFKSRQRLKTIWELNSLSLAKGQRFSAFPPPPLDAPTRSSSTEDHNPPALPPNDYDTFPSSQQS